MNEVIWEYLVIKSDNNGKTKTMIRNHENSSSMNVVFEDGFEDLVSKQAKLVSFSFTNRKFCVLKSNVRYFSTNFNFPGHKP